MTTRRRWQRQIFSLPLVVVLLAATLAAPWGPAAAQQDDGYTTIVLLGGDAGPERKGLRTDTIIVVSVERATGRATMFGIPRNLVQVPLPAELAGLFECRCWPSLINELYPYAEANPALFGGGPYPGATALKGALGELLGLSIDYFALVDLPGFVDVIDALGGVTIDVPEPVTVYISPPKEGEAWQQYDIQTGTRHLDGRTALAYVRSREDGSDYDRMMRQRCLLGALAREADVASLLVSYPDLVAQLGESVLTDVPLNVLPDLIELAGAVDVSQVVAVGFVPPGYNAGWVDPGYPIPDVPLIQATVATALTGAVAAADGLVDLPTTCAWAGEPAA